MDTRDQDNNHWLGTLMCDTELDDMTVCPYDMDDTSKKSAEDDTNYEEPRVLANYFKKLQDRISKECKESNSPHEYIDLKTFWIDPPAPYFALYSGTLNPEKLYYPRVFLWSPHRLLPPSHTLMCHDCKDQKLVSKGYNDKPRARRVVDLDQ